jgi:pimeloyl-ACP methyl ester carboxylesterase
VASVRDFAQSKEGLKLRYEMRGAGEPVALIMGFSGSGRGWGEPFLKLMEARFKIFVIDNRGTGESDKPDAEFTLGDLAADIAAVLDHAKTPRAHIFGISMGGMIAQEFALAYPERSRGLVLGCTNCGSSHSVTADPAALANLIPAPGMDPIEAARVFGGVRKGVSEFRGRAGDSQPGSCGHGQLPDNAARYSHAAGTSGGWIRQFCAAWTNQVADTNYSWGRRFDRAVSERGSSARRDRGIEKTYAYGRWSHVFLGSAGRNCARRGRFPGCGEVTAGDLIWRTTKPSFTKRSRTKSIG